MRLKEKASSQQPVFVKNGEEPQWEKAKSQASKTPDKDQDTLAKEIFLKLVDREDTEEAASALASGQLMRPIKRECREQNYRQFKISEKTKDGSGKDYYPVIIIAEGMGNLKDRNYYTAEAIQSGAGVYEGKKCYFDHPTEDEERARPGRSVREIAGHYEEVTATKINGLMSLRAKLCPVPEERVTRLLDHAVEYKKKYPDKDFIGISINGDGEGVTMEYEDFIKECNPSREEMDKIKEIEGQPVNVITKLTEAVSADLVTEAGAKGQILKENKKQKKKEKLMKFIENMRKLLSGAERGDKKVIEAAVKDMLQDEADEKKEADEGNKVEKEAAGLVKHLLQAKKDLKKEKDESEEAYEMKCMKQAMEKHKAESEKKEADEKKSEDDKEKKEKNDGDADDKKDKKSDEKKEGDPPPKKDAAADKDDKKDAGDKDDKDDEKDPMKKLADKVEAMSKEIESLKKEKKESEKEAKDAKESAAEAIIALKTKQRVDFVDRILAESGLPRYITNEIRPVVERCKTEKEMKETVTKLAEAHSKAMEENFFMISRGGLVERRADDGSGSSTDDLFTNKGDK